MKKIKLLSILVFTFIVNFVNAQDSLVVFSRISSTRIIKMTIISGVDRVAHVKKSDGKIKFISKSIR